VSERARMPDEFRSNQSGEGGEYSDLISKNEDILRLLPPRAGHLCIPSERGEKNAGNFHE